jgi:2-deoxy-D-gluconate 3-dehydrogenase
MILEKFKLDGKCGIVTGGAGGIGGGISQGLIEAGADVIIADYNLEGAEKVAGKLSAIGGGKAIPLQVDMSQEDSIKNLVEGALAEMGKIDFVFNNAGAIHRAPTHEFPKEHWDYMLAVNLTGPFLFSQLVAKHMIERGEGGCFVNTSSLIAVFGGKTVPAYAATKGGLTQLTKTMCNDWSQYGIRANAIGPGWIATDMTAALRQDKEGRYKEITERIPMGRWGTPEDFMGPAVFLVSEASAYINGHVLFIDGGYLAM